MAKILKLNIKNLQLSGKTKKEEVEKEPAAPLKKGPAEQEQKQPPRRLKVDAEITSALKKAEKTLAARDKEKDKEVVVPKRKSRLIQEHTEEKKELKPEVVEQIAPVEPLPKAHTPVVEEAPPSPPVAAPVVEKPAAPKVEEHKETIQKPATPPVQTTAHVGEAPKAVVDTRKGKELKPQKKKEEQRFDARDRQGLRDVENEAWRKRKAYKPKKYEPEEVIRPKELKVRLPITIKDLAQEMKLKASQLIAKLFMQGMTLTLNDYLDDDTVVQLLGHEFGCEIHIDTTEQERINITDRTIRQEIESTPADQIVLRPPVITFMGHVDHGKTSLIDYIRKSNRVAGEAGAITQHIGAFKVNTTAGVVTVIDTPGHEAFSEMRSRGANVTDIVVLVIAGDEGIRMQTEEAMRQAREAKVPILVALNKCDKPNFDAQRVYRELADRDLLPEAWGGTTIVVECSATTGKGIKELLEMTALQAEILELRANANTRARGTILESEMHKGLGAVATVLVQNGTLRKNDAIVFGPYSGRVKTMHDDHGMPVETAGPSTPIKITGLSELALAGSEFVVVKNEKEARELAAARAEGEMRHRMAQGKLGSMERMLAKKESGEMKILPLILRADVQGSLEALKTSLSKIKSNKVRLEIVGADVGEISESDIELAAASKATILGFHTSIESHAEDVVKQKKIPVYMQDVIYHLVDEVKVRMQSLLDKLEQETDTGAAEVRAVFKSSQLGNIAGSMVSDGVIKRTSLIRQVRGGKVIWKGKIASLKRVKDDVKEVQKGFECGIVLEGQSDVREGDLLQAYEVSYLEQEL